RMLLARRWAEFSCWMKGIADFQRAHSFDELAQKVVIDPVRDEEAFAGAARLAGIDRARLDRGGERRFEVGAWHHDKRIASAELKHRFLNLARRRARHRAAGFLAAG